MNGVKNTDYILREVTGKGYLKMYTTNATNVYFFKPTFSQSCPLLGCRKTELEERCLRPVRVPRLKFWRHWGPCLPELQVVHVWMHPRRTGAANARLSAETWLSSTVSTYTHVLPKFTILGLPAMKQTSEHKQPRTRRGKCSFKKKFLFGIIKSMYPTNSTWINIA